MSQLLRVLGRQIVRYRYAVVAFWFGLIVLADLGAFQVAGILKGGSGAIQGSTSLAVDTRLYRDFDNPYPKALLVTFEAPLSLEESGYKGQVEQVSKALLKAPGVRRVMT